MGQSITLPLSTLPVAQHRRISRYYNRLNAFSTREEWLVAFIDAARPVFEHVGATLPDNIRASVGYPTTGHRSSTIGQCIHPEASSDGTWEIFINPKVKLQGNAARLADILTHELIHTVRHDGHGRQFRKVATDLGLVGPMTATTAGDTWMQWALPIIEDLGPMPYAEISVPAPVKKKKTYQHKVECPVCGWYGMVNAKWIDPNPVLLCPVPECQTEMTVHGLKD